jgi:hypothetical protein
MLRKKGVELEGWELLGDPFLSAAKALCSERHRLRCCLGIRGKVAELSCQRFVLYVASLAMLYGNRKGSG